jgi:hypothetical protein
MASSVLIRLAPLLLAAAAVGPHRGCEEPRARVRARPLVGGRPEWMLLECQLTGATAQSYRWILGGGVRPIGGGQPEDSDALLVQLLDKVAGERGRVECEVTLEAGRAISAQTYLGPVAVSAVHAPVPPLTMVTVDGVGFGAHPGPDDALYLVSPHGTVRPADHRCAQASWSESRIVACLPADLPQKERYTLRVEAQGRLALAPGAPLDIP